MQFYSDDPNITPSQEDLLGNEVTCPGCADHTRPSTPVDDAGAAVLMTGMSLSGPEAELLAAPAAADTPVPSLQSRQQVSEQLSSFMYCHCSKSNTSLSDPSVI